jgi:hypothetical protein
LSASRKVGSAVQHPASNAREHCAPWLTVANAVGHCWQPGGTNNPDATADGQQGRGS